MCVSVCLCLFWGLKSFYTNTKIKTNERMRTSFLLSMFSGLNVRFR